jgi:hypothetical protein
LESVIKSSYSADPALINQAGKEIPYIIDRYVCNTILSRCKPIVIIYLPTAAIKEHFYSANY